MNSEFTTNALHCLADHYLQPDTGSSILESMLFFQNALLYFSNTNIKKIIDESINFELLPCIKSINHFSKINYTTFKKSKSKDKWIQGDDVNIFIDTIIEKIEREKIFLLNGCFYLTLDSGHNIMFLFKKITNNTNNTINIYFSNSGAGLNFHYKNNKNEYNLILETEINTSNLKEFLQHIVYFRFTVDDVYARQYYYDFLNQYFKFETPNKYLYLFGHSQLSGSCTYYSKYNLFKFFLTQIEPNKIQLDEMDTRLKYYSSNILKNIVTQSLTSENILSPFNFVYLDILKKNNNADDFISTNKKTFLSISFEQYIYPIYNYKEYLESSYAITNIHNPIKYIINKQVLINLYEMHVPIQNKNILDMLKIIAEYVRYSYIFIYSNKFNFSDKYNKIYYIYVSKNIFYFLKYIYDTDDLFEEQFIKENNHNIIDVFANLSHYILLIRMTMMSSFISYFFIQITLLIILIFIKINKTNKYIEKSENNYRERQTLIDFLVIIFKKVNCIKNIQFDVSPLLDYTKYFIGSTFVEKYHTQKKFEELQNEDNLLLFLFISKINLSISSIPCFHEIINYTTLNKQEFDQFTYKSFYNLYYTITDTKQDNPTKYIVKDVRENSINNIQTCLKNLFIFSYIRTPIYVDMECYYKHIELINLLNKKNYDIINSLYTEHYIIDTSTTNPNIYLIPSCIIDLNLLDDADSININITNLLKIKNVNFNKNLLMDHIQYLNDFVIVYLFYLLLNNNIKFDIVDTNLITHIFNNKKNSVYQPVFEIILSLIINYNDNFKNINVHEFLKLLSIPKTDILYMVVSSNDDMLDSIKTLFIILYIELFVKYNGETNDYTTNFYFVNTLINYTNIDINNDIISYLKLFYGEKKYEITNSTDPTTYIIKDENNIQRQILKHNVISYFKEICPMYYLIDNFYYKQRYKKDPYGFGCNITYFLENNYIFWREYNTNKSLENLQENTKNNLFNGYKINNNFDFITNISILLNLDLDVTINILYEQRMYTCSLPYFLNVLQCSDVDKRKCITFIHEDNERIYLLYLFNYIPTLRIECVLYKKYYIDDFFCHINNDRYNIVYKDIRNYFIYFNWIANMKNAFLLYNNNNFYILLIDYDLLPENFEIY